MKSTKILLCVSILLVNGCSSEDHSPNFLFDGYALSGGDRFQDFQENPFLEVSDAPVSTFSIDADGASYTFARKMIQQNGQLPPKEAIRSEEFINYFPLTYPFTQSIHPISLNGEIAGCPWNENHQIIRIGIQGRSLTSVPSSNFVFLIDVSGSMQGSDRLDLLKQGFKMMVDELTSEDRVAIVTYAGSNELVLASTSGSQKDTIKKAIDKLSSFGGTAGAQGIVSAYEIAEGAFIEGGNNRVIIGTDGDFNVGPSSDEELVSLIESKREMGIFLTVLGVGDGNYNDSALEKIAKHGNGTYEYLDKVDQLKKVFIYEKGKFHTVAKDVKVQVIFNPQLVKSYRLIGYENRLLTEEEFENDSTDAGEIGAGQSITALYEIVPITNIPQVRSSPTFTIDFKYKSVESDESIPLQLDIFDQGHAFHAATPTFKLVTSVAAFAMLLRDSPYSGSASFEQVLDWTESLPSAIGDEYGYISEFRELVLKSKSFRN